MGGSESHVLALVMAVPLITWLGIFGYLVIIDRKLRHLEHGAEQDEL